MTPPFDYDYNSEVSAAQVYANRYHLDRYLNPYLNHVNYGLPAAVVGGFPIMGGPNAAEETADPVPQEE